ncbi:hypothetical protein ABH925_003663 [Streptacidiphilus sp. EB129]
MAGAPLVPRPPHLLLISHSPDDGLEQVLQQIDAAADTEPDVAVLLTRAPLGVTSLAELEHRGPRSACGPPQRVARERCGCSCRAV